MEHRNREFIGPYTVIVHDVMSKNVPVQKDEGSKYEEHSSSSVKPYIGDEHVELYKSPDTISTDYIGHLYQPFADFKTPHEIVDVQLVEVFQCDDPRAKEPRMAKAKQYEV